MTQKELEAKINRCSDYQEICKLMSTYSHYQHMCMWDKIPSMFAQKTDEIEIEIDDGGLNVGLDTPRKAFFERMGRGKTGPSPFYPGFIDIHMLVNPVIEINKNGTRAKALWHSPGLTSRQVGDELEPRWIQGKYVMEYVKEDGEWKILKFNFRRTFHTAFDKGWVKMPEPPPRPASSRVSDKPTTYHRAYDPNGMNVFEPPPPDPYED
ncbi:nuclear transport factor 2 family protein [Thermodesulfobacteriota bacterium]